MRSYCSLISSCVCIDPSVLFTWWVMLAFDFWYSFKSIIYIFGCTGSQLLHAGSSLCHVGSFVAAHGPSSCGLQVLEHVGSVTAGPRLSCSSACGILVPQPGIEPMSPALTGGFLSTGPPGKSLQLFLESLSLSPSIVHFLVFCLPAFWVLIPVHPKPSLRR